MDRAMLLWAHKILMTLYLVLPPLGLAWSIWRGRKSRSAMRRSLRACGFAIITSMLLGGAASIIYGLWGGGLVPPDQVLLTCYFAAGLICLRLLDLTLDRAVNLIFHAGDEELRLLGQIVRVVLLFVIGLPYMVVAAATYRPRVLPPPDGAWSEMGAENIAFKSTDGLTIVGLWIPAREIVAAGHHPRWGRETAIVCQGAKGELATYVILARQLLASGYNVLTFDFRAKGRSDGELTTFGDLERYDVLGAIHWARQRHAAAAQRIVGIGVSTGAAAMLAAANDFSDDGHALSALVVYGGYDQFSALAAGVWDSYIMPPLQWVGPWVGTAFASVQTGADLCDFSPADEAAAIAPRPILFIHGRRDSVFQFDMGQRLYQSASAPKSYLWLDATGLDALENPDVAAAARRFLDGAIPML